nr:MAG TPA: hypothetical protein [Bacteriophage sp.]DAP50538.1 MAG TPA: hypothetical protein [Caudoviricetes sp.]DAQ65880.1 MAG TPA: hypothetical protein [Bacteriophage sp.]DAR60190.1 MAG TPA: hypothetical protein [Caudoviricetes sp.]
MQAFPLHSIKIKGFQKVQHHLMKSIFLFGSFRTPTKFPCK